MAVAVAFTAVPAAFGTIDANAASPGSYYKVFDKAPTKKEKQLVKKYPRQALGVFALSRVAEEMTVKYYGYSGRGDNSDAFRHCLWSALLKQRYGKKIAKRWVSAHEGKSKSLESRMDRYNNKIGYSMKVKKSQSYNAVAKKVKKKIVKGKCRRLNKKRKKLRRTNGSGLLQ